MWSIVWSYQKLKEHLSQSSDRGFELMPFFCFYTAGGLKSHVEKRYKEAALATNVPFGN